MLQLQNRTPFDARLTVFPDRDAIDTLYVIVKGTCVLRPRLALADVQVPVSFADQYFGDPAVTSLRQIADVHVGKPGTDVLLMGHAYAPGGEPVTEMLVSMEVAERRKTIRVMGDRVWCQGKPTPPRPFKYIPLVWERAFGGTDTSSEHITSEPRNPVGLGFCGAKTAERMEGEFLPNLEDPSASLAALGQQIDPVCFAPIAPWWLPRRAFAGTYDEAWQRERAPYLPEDFDPRFLQSAPQEFGFDRYLLGGEVVFIEGATPDEPLHFAVPSTRVMIEARVADQLHRLEAHLETLLIEPDINRASLTWRAAVPCGRHVLKSEVSVSLYGTSHR